MEQKTMSEWIKQLAQKERDRRVLISKFEKAVPAFIKALIQALESDASAYQIELLGEGDIDIQATSDGLTITPSGAEYLSARVTIHPTTQTIHWCIGRGERPKIGEERLQVSELGLHFGGVSQDYTVAKLSEKILRPIVFPML
jgi:uncharacterized protein YjaZ